MQVWIVLLLLGIFLVVANQIAVILFPFFAPSGTIPTGIIHYYQDYFYYLNQITQGTHGAWLTAEHYTSEILPKIILYWQHIYIGRIGGFLHLPPPVTYNVSIALFVLSFPFLIYAIATRYTPLVWKRLSIVFLSLLTTGLMHRVQSPNGWDWVPFQIWRSPHPLFNRLGGVPGHLFQTLLFYLVWIAILSIPHTRPKWNHILVLALLSFLLSSLNPAMILVALAGLGCSYVLWGIRHAAKPRWMVRIGMMMGISAVAVYIPVRLEQSLLAVPPHSIASVWEAANQVHPLPLELVASIGPILIPMVIGMIYTLIFGSLIEYFAFFTLCIGYTMFLSPIPLWLHVINLRFIFPGLYVAIAILAVNGLEWIGKLVKTPNMRSFVSIGTTIIIAVGIPSAAYELRMKISEVNQPGSIMVYIPTDIHELLESALTLPKDTAILANPNTGLDTIAPAYTNHPSYSGHILMTIDNPQKQQRAGTFYSLTMTPAEAENFVRTGNIRYILVTRLDPVGAHLEKTYPFLHPVITKPAGAIYEVRLP